MRILSPDYLGHAPMGSISMALMIAAGAVCLAVASEPPAGKSDTTLAAQVADDFKTIGRRVVAYRMDNGHFPEALSLLQADLPKDAYGRSGEGYRYEAERGRFILSSCGEDGVYGNDDDVLLVAQPGRKTVGLRREIGALPPDVGEGQWEQTGPMKRRPQGSCRLAGRVLDAATGEPVGHATVYLFYKDTLDALFVDVGADGSFEFKGIPSGGYRLKVNRAAGYQPQEYLPDGQVDFTLADREERADIVFRLKPGYRITGRVLDDKGQVLPGEPSFSVVAVKAAGGTGRVQAMVRQDGTYVLDGLSGEPVYVFFQDHQAQAKENAYPIRYWPGTFSQAEATPVAFKDATVRDGIDIALARTGGRVLLGRVTDAIGGAPIPDALIVAHGEEALFDRVTAYTDAEGRYRLEALGTGTLLVQVDATPQNYVHTKKKVTLGDKGPVEPLDFALNKGVTLAGRIVDEKGAELPVVAPNTFGAVHTKGWVPPDGRSFSGVRNRNAPPDKARGVVFYHLGEGDDGSAAMSFPTTSTFVVMGSMPGEVWLSFRPSLPDKAVLGVTRDGKEISIDHPLATQAGQKIENILITVGPKPAK